ncbi:phage tail protein [Streptomyces sp. p1417]|uniref:Phage tail protein n=1 Tax=Streptomyces typhae TaxID=2681492 RepID=A0A6L6WR74_9ACTN|nr:phage tail protein [Streptomyces typhae]MVO84197.1 phage tail protein [Streptomyces typhae]
MSDDVTITVRVNNQTAAGFRDIHGQIRTLDGRFATAAGGIRRSSSGISQALVDVKASMLSLAPAAVPVAAAMAPVAAKTGAAGLALVAFGAALKPQISNLQDVSAAQDKYNDAVTQYGRQSKQAMEAQQAVAQTLRTMPKETQRAAVGYQLLREETKAWSDDMARFTMAPVEKSFAVMGQVVPKLTPMVRGASTELDRLMSVAGGAVNTSAFDALMDKVSAFANSSLREATDDAIHFARVLSEGGGGEGAVGQFFAYARENGPAVRELLSSVAQAAGNLAAGAAEAGPGLLAVVNALAQLVAAVPPEVIGTLMQVYAAFKLITLAGAGIAATSAAAGGLATRVTALGTASAAAGGGLAGLRAAFMALGATAKASVVVAGIAAVAVAVHKLSSMGREAPPNVERLTTSLGRLGQSGKIGGEAARVFGDDLGGLYDKIRSVSDPATVDKVQQGLVKIFSLGMADSTPVKEAKQNLAAIDDALAGLVKGGKAEQAAQAFEALKRAYRKGGGDVGDLKDKLDGYKSALADQRFEQELAAQSMGLFGAQAQKAQASLDAQKRSADGLRQSLQALNDAQRQGLGGMIGFEAAIDAAAKAAQSNAGALSMSGGKLNLNSEKARDAASALNDLAAKTDEAAAQARQSGASWETVNGIYARGRGEFLKQAQAMGLTAAQARQLAGQIMKIPSKKSTRLEMRTEDAVTGLNSVIAAMKRTPKAKSVTVKALTKDAVALLQSLGLKVRRMPDGSFRVTAKTGAAHSSIGAVRRARDGLKNKTISIGANTGAFRAAVSGLVGRVLGTSFINVVYRKNPAVGAALLGGMRAFGASGGLASTLPQKRFASGGAVQAFPNGGPIQGPGTSTSDSILGMFPSGATARVSDSEYVVQARAVKKYGVRFLDALNDGRLLIPGLKKGGLTKAQRAERAREAARVQREARNTLWDQFGISHFGRKAGYQRDPFEKALGAPSDLGSLVSSLNQARGNIKRATSGGTERRLLRALDSTGKSLIRNEKSLSKVNTALDKAKDKLGDLRSSASQLQESVRSNVLSAASILRGQGEGKPVTVRSVMSGLIDSRDKATAFSGALSTLKKRGLDKGLLRQIAEAGIDGGGLETAGALMRASSSEIKSMNSLQAQIAKSALSSGKTAADAFYGAAIKAQEKLVKGLQKSQDKLEKAMAKLARALEKTIARGLRGRKAAGGIIGAAASGGIRSGLTWVGEHEPELLDLPVGSRVRSGPDSRRLAAAASGGPREPIVLELRSSGSDVDEFLLKILRRAIKTRGRDVQLVLAGRPA